MAVQVIISNFASFFSLFFLYLLFAAHKGARKRPKKTYLHDLPLTEILNSGTIRLATD